MTTTTAIIVLVAFVLGAMFGGLITQIRSATAISSLPASHRDFDEIDVMAPHLADTQSFVRHITVGPHTGWILYGKNPELCLTTAEAMAKTVGHYRILDAEHQPAIDWITEWLDSDALIVTGFNPTAANLSQAEKAVEYTECVLILISPKMPLLDARSNLRTLAV